MTHKRVSPWAKSVSHLRPLCYVYSVFTDKETIDEYTALNLFFSIFLAFGPSTTLKTLHLKSLHFHSAVLGTIVGNHCWDYGGTLCWSIVIAMAIVVTIVGLLGGFSVGTLSLHCGYLLSIFAAQFFFDCSQFVLFFSALFVDILYSERLCCVCARLCAAFFSTQVTVKSWKSRFSAS